MTRSVATFLSGNLPVVTSGQQANLLGILTASIQNFTSSGVPAFELAELVTAASGTFDAVFHSIGDRTITTISASNAGDTDIWLRIVRTAAGTFQFGCMQDWSPTSSDATTGIDSNPGAGRGSNTNANTSTTWTTISDTQAIDYWGVGNEYEHMFIFNQGGTFKHVHWGNASRLAPKGANGVARIRTATTASGVVTIELDRQMSGTLSQTNVWKQGQRIWIVPQTVDGAALTNQTVDIVTINKVMSGSGEFGNQYLVNVATTTKTYPSGSLIGHQPNNCFMTTGGTTLSTTLYGTQRTDGGYVVNAQTLNHEYMSNVAAEGDVDPDPSNFIQGFGIYMHSIQASFTGPRGISDVVAVFAIGTQVNGDRMIVGDKFYFVFPSVLFSSYAMALGPCRLP